MAAGDSNGHTNGAHHPQHKEPMKLKGVLKQFKSRDMTPIIGTEFQNANLAEWLTAPDSDDLLRDLAITSMF